MKTLKSEPEWLEALTRVRESLVNAKKDVEYANQEYESDYLSDLVADLNDWECFLEGFIVAREVSAP